MRVNYDEPDGRDQGIQTFLNGIGGVLTLRGGGGGDLYEIGLSGLAVSPTGPQTRSRSTTAYRRRRQPAPDLRHEDAPTSSCCARTSRRRTGVGVSAFQVDADGQAVAGGFYERDQLRRRRSTAASSSTAARATTRSCFDDNLAADRRSFGDEGDDTFQIGQVFQSARDGSNPDNGLAPEDYFETTLTTRGYLSNGIRKSTTHLRRHRQRLVHGLPQPRRAVPVRRAGRRHVPRPRVRARQPGRPEGAVHEHQRRPGRRLHLVHGQRAGARRRRRRSRHARRRRDRVRRRLRGHREGRLRRRPVHHVRRRSRSSSSTRRRATTPSSSSRRPRTSCSRSTAGSAPTPSTSAARTASSITVVSNSLEGHSGLIDNFLFTQRPELHRHLRPGSVGQGRRQRRGRDRHRARRRPAPRVRAVAGRRSAARSSVVTYSIVLTRSPEETVRVTAAPVPISERERLAGGKRITLNGARRGGDARLRPDELVRSRRRSPSPRSTTPSPRARGSSTSSTRSSRARHPDDGGAYDTLVAPGVTVTVVDDEAADVLSVPVDPDTRHRRRSPCSSPRTHLPRRAPGRPDLPARHRRLHGRADPRAERRRRRSSSRPTARPTSESRR